MRAFNVVDNRRTRNRDTAQPYMAVHADRNSADREAHLLRRIEGYRSVKVEVRDIRAGLCRGSLYVVTAWSVPEVTS